jgi:tetratricopeptide (TPR) repeat protein
MGREAERWDAVEEAAELLLEGEPQRALGQLRDVLRDDPENAYGFFYLATALYEIERYDAARDAFRAAVTLSPEYMGARVGLSHTLLRLGDAREALTVAEETLARVADDGDSFYAAGCAAAALGERASARKWFTKFLKSKPELETQLEVQGFIDLLAQGNEGDPLRLG